MGKREYFRKNFAKIFEFIYLLTWDERYIIRATIAIYVTINDGLEHLKNIASLEDSTKFLKSSDFLYLQNSVTSSQILP